MHLSSKWACMSVKISVQQKLGCNDIIPEARIMKYVWHILIKSSYKHQLSLFLPRSFLCRSAQVSGQKKLCSINLFAHESLLCSLSGEDCTNTELCCTTEYLTNLFTVWIFSNNFPVVFIFKQLVWLLVSCC